MQKAHAEHQPGPCCFCVWPSILLLAAYLDRQLGVSQVSDDALEEKVHSLRGTVSSLEAELEKARKELEANLEILASRKGQPSGSQAEVRCKDFTVWVRTKYCKGLVRCFVKEFVIRGRGGKQER